MDHIPLPSSARLGHPTVSLCDDNAYDGGPFLDYPERAGFDEEQLITKGSLDVHFQESCAQRWLFFGLLEAFFGKAFSREDFIDRSTRPASVHTRNFYHLVMLLFSTEESMADFARRVTDAEKCVQKCSIVCFGLRGNMVFDASLLLSLQTTGSFLSHVLHQFHSMRSTTEVHRAGAWTPRKVIVVDPKYDCLRDAFQMVNELEQVMLDSGWCPSQISRVAGLSCLESAYYFSRMRAPSPGLHTRCSRAFCVAARGTDSQQLTVSGHTPECPGCRTLAVNSEHLENVLARGGHAVVDASVPFDALDEVKLMEVRQDEDIDYVAISHVWSQGLGHSMRNVVPVCQLNRVRNMVGQVQGTPIPFWLDTLCCPVGDTEGTKKVLQSIRFIYSKAAKVLVLDRDLSDYAAAKDTRCVEWILRIYASEWMARLWTLTEGILPDSGRLCFQFSDGPINIDRIEQASDEIGLDDQMVFKRDTLFAIFGFRGLDAVGIKGCRVSGFQQLLHVVRHRSVTQSEDEPLCISYLMELDTKSITDGPREHWMERLWQALVNSGNVGFEILFWGSECLSTPGFRWAPSSLLGREQLSAANAPHRPVLSTEGLRISCAGLYLAKSPTLPIHHAFGILDEERNWTHLVTTAIDDSLLTCKEGVKYESTMFEPPEHLESHTRMALIFTQDPRTAMPPNPVYATMLYLTEHKDGVQYARRAFGSGIIQRLDVSNPTTLAVVHRLRSSSTTEQVGTDSEVQPGLTIASPNPMYSALVGRWTTGDQEWCID